MTEHTPPPWCAREDSANCITIHFDPQHPNADGDEIASVYRDGIEINDEMRADASFIVKAVNSHDKLIAALESIAGWQKVNISAEYELGLRDIIRSITDCAAAALALTSPESNSP